jgi:RNA polymerase sigma factor (sigma-70 family)
VTASDISRATEAVWRIESARVTAAVARRVRDFGMAEEFAQEAFLAALEQWPRTGIPDNPGAWLTTVAQRRAVDHLRREERLQRKTTEIARDLQSPEEPSNSDAVKVFGDELLPLFFTACHPVLSPDARVALTLRVLGGLKTEEIARAFLMPESTIAQRIVRAKRALADGHVPYEVPAPDELHPRLESVLEAIYLIFNEGYSATAGEDWVRPALCEDALAFGRTLARLLPEEPEVHGLVALMEIQASRLRARVATSGDPILLADQNRALWDRLLLNRGFAALRRAEELVRSRGPYTLQAAIAACHARAIDPVETDWERIAQLYDELASLMPSPVVELNRAVAHAMASGPERGLELTEPLMSDARLSNYYLLPAVRGDLLEKIGRIDEAMREFKRAASMTLNQRGRELLLARAEECQRRLEAGAAAAP